MAYVSFSHCLNYFSISDRIYMANMINLIEVISYIRSDLFCAQFPNWTKITHAGLISTQTGREDEEPYNQGKGKGAKPLSANVSKPLEHIIHWP